MATDYSSPYKEVGLRSCAQEQRALAKRTPQISLPGNKDLLRNRKKGRKIKYYKI